MTPLLFFASFVYTLYGLSGTVPTYRDSGDLIASIHTLGIAHPPGYALYVLLGKLFVTILPFGNIAYRVNVMSAVFAAGATAVIYSVLRRDRTPSWVAAATAVLLATSPAFVALGRAAEMYTLSAFLSALILLALFSDTPDGTALAALLLGLGLSVHPTLIFLAPLFLMSSKRTLTRRSVIGFLLGLCVFLYLPIRAAQHPLLNWGDPSHWRNFWRVVTRADYGGLKLHPEQSVFSWTPGSIFAQLRFFLSAFRQEWGWVAFLLGGAGIFSSLARPESRRRGAGLLLSWILAGPLFVVISNLPLQEPTTPAILQPYLLLVSVLWAPFVAWGCQAVLSRASRRAWIPASVAILLVAGRPLAWSSQRNDFYAYDYARNLLRSLPPSAVLYEPDDPTHFSIGVLQTVEHRRADIVLLSFFRTRWGYEAIKRRWPELLPPIPMENGQQLQQALWSYSARKFPFYADLPQKFVNIPYYAQGLVYAARVSPHAEDPAQSRARAETLLDIYPERGDYVTTHHADFFTRHVISYYAAAENNLGIEYANVGDWRNAARHYRRALAIEPDQNAGQANLAVALQKMRKLL